MTTPPGFGGRDIDMAGQADRDGPPAAQPEEAEDHEARAPGETCARCGGVIWRAHQVRRRADRRWVHVVCP
ncbi:MAG TPA: hypothetical protein VEL03_07545 [Streptosporangiaceae bacterium]|nr:hypothetical protein [Streptosporangiaceae bacterium]